jgi:PKD repeat protein
MKKIVTSALFALLSVAAISQSSFFVPTTYRGAFAPAPTPMWTQNWTNWNPQTTVYGTPNVNITTSITNNTTWTSNNIYLLQGAIYVKNGAVLTIQPGTVIMGDKNIAGSGLFIVQGSQIMAQGTETAPIVFTSNQAPGSRAPGDWGGIIILGSAANNQANGVAFIEGLAPTADTQFGGGLNPDNNDNSGVLTYVRNEFGGYAYQQDKEINGFTFGSVGKATTIHHLQCSYNNDDAFEWFGGNVNATHLVSYRNLDDDMDTDFGFQGMIQFALIVRDPNLADNPSISTSEGFESDNDQTGSAATPQTSPIFSNVTAIGPYRGNLANVIATGHRRGARLRRNTALKLYNSIFMDFQRGIHIDGSAAEGNATNGLLKYKNNIVAGTQAGKTTEKNTGSSFNIVAFFAANNNDSLVSTSGILTTPYDYLTPDYRPAAGSLALSNASFADAVINPLVLFAPAATATYTYCAGATATALTATATGTNLLKWYTVATGGTALTSAPTPSTATAGTFTYYVAQANASGTEGPRTAITVTVNALPATPVITANGPTTFCTGGSVDLTTATASTYAWTGGLQTQTITVNASGSYIVTITDANGCSATANAITVNVSNAPVPTIQTVGNTSLCAGETVTLTASQSDSYAWSTGDTTQTINVTAAGAIYVTVSNANACDGVGQSATVNVTVTPQPVAIVGSPAINGNIVTFSNNSTDATAYSWDFGDFTNSSASAPVHAYAASTSYQVTLTATNGNCTSDTTFTVAITVGLEELNNVAEIVLFPNPTATNAQLSMNVIEAGNVEVAIQTVNGQLVKTILNDYLTAGKQTITIETADLANGVYFTTIKSGNAMKTVRLNIIK